MGVRLHPAPVFCVSSSLLLFSAFGAALGALSGGLRPSALFCASPGAFLHLFCFAGRVVVPYDRLGVSALSARVSVVESSFSLVLPHLEKTLGFPRGALYEGDVSGVWCLLVFFCLRVYV